MSSAQKQKIKIDDLRAVGDSVRDITGWDASVDTITAYAQVVEDQKDDHEVIVEDKRKRTDTEAGSIKKHDTKESRKKETEKGKFGPSFKLMSDIEKEIYLKKVLETRILDSHMEFSLREILGIAKREFHDEIIDIVRRKKQINEQVRHMDLKVAYEVVSNEPTTVASQQSSISSREVKSHFTRKYWARATTEHYVKIGDIPDPMMALIGHGSEINIMSGDFYSKGGWPIDTRLHPPHK